MADIYGIYYYWSQFLHSSPWILTTKYHFYTPLFLNNGAARSWFLMITITTYYYTLIPIIYHSLIPILVHIINFLMFSVSINTTINLLLVLFLKDGTWEKFFRIFVFEFDIETVLVKGLVITTITSLCQLNTSIMKI